MMALALLVFGALGFAYFVYEGIIAPSLRLSLRYRLFALRDELRELHWEGAGCSPEAFDVLQSAINTNIRFLPRVTLELVVKAEHAMANDDRMRRAVEQRSSVIAQCRNPEVRRIHGESMQILRRALLVNSAGWLLWIFPILIGMYWYGRIKAWTSHLAAMPENDVERVFPGIGMAA